MTLFRLILALALCLSVPLACGSAKSVAKKDDNAAAHMLIMDKSGVKLNSFTLTQSEFPILKSLDALPPEGTCDTLPRAAVAEFVRARYADHGYHLTMDYSFNFGKVHVGLLGYQPELAIGVLFVAREDYETAITPDGSDKPARGLFYTQKDPKKINAPELIMLEQLNAEGRCYMAFINAYQFCVDPQNRADSERKAWEELGARLELYLAWLDTRHELSDANGESAAEAAPAQP